MAEFIESEFRDKPRDRDWVLNVMSLDAESYRVQDVREAVTRYYQRSWSPFASRRGSASASGN